MPNTNKNKNGTALLHVAIIMDGNGRWAIERGKQRIDGHMAGAKRIGEVAQAAKDLGVKYLTLYAFSSENWNRPREEVDALMSLLKHSIISDGENIVKNRTRFLTIGDVDALPQDCIDEIRNLEFRTREFTESNLVLALNYGSRDEMRRTVKKIVRDTNAGKLDVEKLEWKDIAERLDTAEIPDPDLVIRTSGEMRLSNYLMMQAAYAELYFTKTYWPDFGREEFTKAVNDFRNRERRYGLTGAQLKK